jgi:hypothetical protein
MTKTNPAYPVGYACPPKEHQYRPGQSGNPSGRPKGVRSFKADLHNELSELVAVSDGNKDVEITKQQAIIKVLLRMAIGGDPRAISTIVNSCSAFGEDSSADEIDAPEDRAIMKAVSRPKRRGNAGTKPQLTTGTGGQ